MKVRVNGEELDVFVYDNASVNFQIAITSNLNERIVPATPTISIPKTQRNVDIIEPLLATKNVIENCEIEFENGMVMPVVMYVNTSSKHGFGDVYSVRLVSVLAFEIGKLRHDTIGNLFDASDNWAYIFRQSGTTGDVKTDPNGKWFIAAPNRNGEDYENNQYPVYSDKFISKDIGDVYIGMSMYSFIKTAFDKYGLNAGFNSGDEILDGVSLSDVKIFFPVKFITSDDRSMEFDIYVKDDNTIGIKNIQDKLEQGTMQPDKITATTDTVYDVSVGSADGSSITFTLHHYDVLDGGAPVDVSGKVVVQVLVMKDDAIVKALDMATFDFTNGDTYDSNGEITKTVTGVAETLHNMELLATSEITFKIVTKFIDYKWSNCCNGDCDSGKETITFNYTTENFPASKRTLLNCIDTDGNQVEYDFGLSVSSDIHVKMTSTENISACTRVSDNIMAIETVDMVKTMNNTNIKISDVIDDLLKRFNAGFYLKQDGSIAIASFNNRYVAGASIDMVAWENGYTINYLDKTLGLFTYKNKFFRVKDKYFTMRDDTKYMNGDVIEQNFGGDKDETISLSSGLAFGEMYSDEYFEITSDDYDMITMRDENGDEYGREFFGVPYNKNSDEKAGDFLIGFVDTFATDNIYMPVVQMFQRDANDPETNLPTVSYVKDANMSSGVTLSGTPVNVVKPTHLFNGDDVLRLGDIDTHEVDKTTKLYKNFIPVLEPRTSYLEIQTVADAEFIESILNGMSILLHDEQELTQEYFPTEIDGVMLEQNKSVVKIKLVK